MLRKMTEKYVDCGDGMSYGYGLMVLEGAHGTAFLHSGATPRFLSFVMYSPQKELFLSIMSNYASETTFSVTNDVSEKILNIIH